MSTQAIQDKPNGPVAAALLAGGIGSAAMGIVTTLAAAIAPFSTSLNWYSPVGPLTGKSLSAMVIYFVSWLVLHLMWRGKEVNFRAISIAALVLLAIGLLGTFPPVFDLFVPK